MVRRAWNCHQQRTYPWLSSTLFCKGIVCCADISETCHLKIAPERLPPTPGQLQSSGRDSKSARLRSVPTVQGTTVWQMFTEVTWAADVSAKSAYWQVCETSPERSRAFSRRYGDCTLDCRFVLFRVLNFWSRSEVFYVWYGRRTLWCEVMGCALN